MTIWKDYKNTRDALHFIHSKSGGKIPCKPVIKVLEDGLIVGLITETHQFIQINPPSENIFMDGLEVMDNNNWNTVDKKVAVSTSGDKKREEMVKHILLETQFYSTFRSIFRKLLNVYQNKKTRGLIVNAIENPKLFYDQKIDIIQNHLRTLGEETITFDHIEPSVLMELNDITECSPYSHEETPYCLLKEDGTHKLIIPKEHLLNKHDNEEIYYVRLADELLRYNQVRLFMFQPKQYLNVKNVNYQIQEDEFVIIQSQLMTDYFKDIHYVGEDIYFTQTNSEFARPAITQTYVNEVIPISQQQYVEVGEDVSSQQKSECIKEMSIPIVGNTTSLWVKSFPKLAREMVFHGSPSCSFQLMIQILSIWKKKQATVQNIKELLWNAYSSYVPKYLPKIIQILKSQGKTSLVEMVAKGRSSFETLVLGEGYFMTDLDYWMMASKYNIPIVLIASTFLKGTLGRIKWLKLGGSTSEQYFFVRSTLTSERNQQPEYHLIVPQYGLNELGEFTVQYQKALRREAEFVYCLQTLVEMLEKIEFIVIAKKRAEV